MASIKGLIVGMLLISCIIIIFSGFYTGLNTEYTSTEYDSSAFSTFNKATNLTNSVEDIKDSINPSYDDGALDILGAYFKAGYYSLYTGFRSLDLFTDMAEDISETSALSMGGVDNATGKATSNIIIAIVIILLCFTIIGALLKWDRI